MTIRRMVHIFIVKSNLHCGSRAEALDALRCGGLRVLRAHKHKASALPHQLQYPRTLGRTFESPISLIRQNRDPNPKQRATAFCQVVTALGFANDTGEHVHGIYKGLQDLEKGVVRVSFMKSEALQTQLRHS